MNSIVIHYGDLAVFQAEDLALFNGCTFHLAVTYGKGDLAGLNLLGSPHHSDVVLVAGELTVKGEERGDSLRDRFGMQYTYLLLESGIACSAAMMIFLLFGSTKLVWHAPAGWRREYRPCWGSLSGRH